MMVTLHASFVILAYDADFLSALDAFGSYSIVIERALMLLQFLPLILILCSQRFSKSRFLLLLAFAMCVSTLFIVDDFNTGFYGAVLDYKSGIVPRMRTSAHLLAYEDSGRLVSLDPHADYFLEFVVVHFLSEVLGLNYVLVSFSIVRVALIVLWSSLFVLASGKARTHHAPIWSIILAASMLSATQSYNYEVSFGPLFLLMWFILINARFVTREHTICTMAITVGILLASFRESLLLTVVSLVATCLAFFSSQITNARPFSSWRSLSITLCLVLGSARVFQFSSLSYARTYLNWFQSLVDSILAALVGGLSFKSQPLSTVLAIGNPVDREIALVSVISYFALLTLLAILSLLILFKSQKPHHSNALSFAVPISFLFASVTVVGAYSVLKILGAGPLHDYSSATVLIRSLAPLVVLIAVPYFTWTWIKRNVAAKLLMLLVVTGLSLLLVFSSFLFLRAEVKSSYDMQRISGSRDWSEATIFATDLYRFTLSYNTPIETIVIGRNASFLQLYYTLPLAYKTGRLSLTESPYVPFPVKVFDNGMFEIELHNQMILLDEKN